MLGFFGGLICVLQLIEDRFWLELSNILIELFICFVVNIWFLECYFNDAIVLII
jgi:hypothetical protein